MERTARGVVQEENWRTVRLPLATVDCDGLERNRVFDQAAGRHEKASRELHGSDLLQARAPLAVDLEMIAHRPAAQRLAAKLRPTWSLTWASHPGEP